LLSEDNEVPIHNQIGLEKWLTKGAKPGLNYFPKIMWAATKTRTGDLIRKRDCAVLANTATQPQDRKRLDKKDEE